MSQIILVAVGAILGGIVQTLLSVWQRYQKREATLLALISEISAICDLLREQCYLDDYEKLKIQIESGMWDGAVWLIDFRSDYFSVYNAVLPSIGRLKSTHALEVVRFYMLCKSLIDAVRPDGAGAKMTNLTLRADNVDRIISLFKEIFARGEKICRLSRCSEKMMKLK